MNNVGSLKKIWILHQTIRNWPVILFDRLGFRKLTTYKCREGFRFLCRSRTSDINEVVVVISGNEYPRRFLRIREGAIVFDIGAHIGSFVVYADSIAESWYRGYAFEPWRENLQLLLANIELNQVHGFEVVEAAISDKDGFVQIETGVQPDAVHLTEEGGTKVRSIRLSTFCRENKISRIDVMKIDAEGAEYRILEGDLPFIKTNVELLVMEYHKLSAGRDLDRISRQLCPEFKAEVIHAGDAGGTVAFRRT